MSNRTLSVSLIVAGLLAVALVGSACSSDSRGATGTLRLLITDKPFPFEFVSEANITITRVEVRQSAEQPACATSEDCMSDDPCSEAECANGECVYTPTDCEDGDPCTADSCAAGVCEHTALECPEGQVCNGQNCALACTAAEECDDGDDCTADECADGVCVNEPACDSDEGPDGDEDEDDGSPWIVLFEGEREFNLLDLQNGRTDLLADAVIPAGTYTQMRLIVTSGEVVLDDEDQRTFPLSVPSGAQTGIKLHFSFTVDADQESAVLLDVDVSKAFLPVPGGRIEDPSTIREFKFKPSLAMKLIEVVDAGSVAGTVRDENGDPIANASVTALLSDNDIATTATEADGTYAIVGLSTATYVISVSATGYTDGTASADVQAGDSTTGIDIVMVAESEL